MAKEEKEATESLTFLALAARARAREARARVKEARARVEMALEISAVLLVRIFKKNLDCLFCSLHLKLTLG